MISYALINEREQEFLWHNRIPLGMITLIAAKRKVGKGQVACDLHSRVSRDALMPDGTPGLLGSTITITREDDPEVVMVRRLKAAEANREYVFDLTNGPDGDGFHLGTDIPYLWEQIQDINDDPHLPNVRLVVLDPLNQVASGLLRSDAKVRKWGVELAKLARHFNVAVVLIHHLVKSGEIAGATGIQDVVRSILKIERDESDPRVRTITLEASNVAPEDVADIRYTVVDEGNGAHAAWLTEPPSTVSLTPSQREMFDALQIGRKPMTVDELAKAANVTTPSARVMIHKLNKAGLIESVRSGSGVYQLAPSLLVA